MSNPLYEALKNAPAAMPSTAQYLAQIKANPIAFIRQAGYNIPDGIASPQQMINYLLTSGQRTPAQFAQAQRAAGQFRR